MISTMNKNLKKQVHVALKAAKHYLRDGETFNNNNTDYICIALTNATKDYFDLFKGAEKAKKIISGRLGSCYSFCTWLELNGVTEEELCDYKRLQRHRHAWLDQLIEEFSE